MPASLPARFSARQLTDDRKQANKDVYSNKEEVRPVSVQEGQDLRPVVRALLDANKRLTDALEQVIGPAPAPDFVPSDFQRDILAALNGKGLRTDALAAKVGNRRKLFADPGGLPELQEEGLVSHHKRVGYYRPDAPPPDLNEKP